ncbi:hypothetical protein [Pseudomonas sp. nanlin1]|uniref:hypothetical protein n=1 Tax=Pseudomonas sp. nanlin1 TaxID=3040605 RepID=UPI00388F917F
MNFEWLRFRWLLNRKTAHVLLWIMVLLATALLANVVGIYLVGSVTAWQHWMAAASGYFLVWRLALYAATARGWLWMRRRLLAREPDSEARYRLIRTEVAGVAAIVVLEISLLLQS